MFRHLSLELRLWLFAVLLGLPFIGRSYFVDDHYQLLMAKGLLDHPSRPYDFRAADAGPDNAGWERGGFPRMVNPPLHHYLMAALLKVSGDPSLGPSAENPRGGRRIWVVRLGMLMFSALSIPLLALLARRCLAPPGAAGVLAALTPAFWLSSYGLLIDSTLLTFFLGALVSWIEGVKRNRPLLLLLSGLLMGATILTKYTGAFVGGLAVLYWLLEKPEDGRRRPSALLFLALPALVLTGWTAWNVATYGASHLAESSKRVMQTFDVTHLLTFLTFFGGVLLFPLDGWAWLWRRHRSAAAGLAAAGVLFAAFLMSGAGGFSPAQAVMLSVLFLGGGAFFAQALAAGEGRRVPTDLFLMAWLWVGTAQMLWVMQWVAARYYLTLLPPALLLLLRVWERELRHAPRARSVRVSRWAAGLFAAGLALAVGDHMQAGAQRRAAGDAADVTAAGVRYVLGDSFTASTLTYAGWTPAFASTPFMPGDVVLAPTVVMRPWWFRPGPGMALERSFDYPSAFPLRLMDNEGAAGFYASVWGALPFTFSTGPLERYQLWRVAEHHP